MNENKIVTLKLLTIVKILHAQKSLKERVFTI